MLAREDVRLTVDERGAEVTAEAVVVAVAAIPTEYVIDGPFLVAILAPGSEQPYALAWIGGEHGLTRWGEPTGRALTRAELEPLVGAWQPDLDRSVEETLAAMRRALEKQGSDYPVSRDMVERWLRDRSLRIDVGADGDVRAITTRGDAPDGSREEEEPSIDDEHADTDAHSAPSATPHLVAARLEHDGASPVLVLPLTSRASDAPRGAAPAGELSWHVRRVGDELHLALPAQSIVQVLRPR